MSETTTNHRLTKLKVTFDGWAGATAFLLALLVRMGVLKRVLAAP